MTINKNIIVQLQIEGVHFWKNCDLKDVDYLKYLHRHTFHIKVAKAVTHNDRDIEIIKFKTDIRAYLLTNFYDHVFKLCNFKNMSCEDIAELIYNEFDCAGVQVLEDNENGAEIQKA